MPRLSSTCACTDRHRRRRRPRSAATSPAWSGRPPGSASSAWSIGCTARPGLAGVDAARRAATSPIDPGCAPTTTRERRTAARSASSCRANATSSAALLRGAGDDARLLVLGGDCTAHAGAMAGLRARSPGPSPRPRLVRRARRLQHARHDPVRQRLGHAVRDDLRPRRRRSRRRVRRPDASAKRMPRLLGGQVLDETESRMLAAVADRPLRGRDARRPTPAWPPLAAWARTRRDAGRWPLYRRRHGLPRRGRRLGRHDAGAGRAAARDGRRRRCHRCAEDRSGRRPRGDRDDPGQWRRGAEPRMPWPRLAEAAFVSR